MRIPTWITLTQVSVCKQGSCNITSVMIYHRGASLSKQHTYLLICHCTKQDLSRTSRYVDKSSEIARYRIVCQQPGQLLSVWLHMHKH